MKAIAKDGDLALQVIVTGMHLSPEFGLTYKEVEQDFTIAKKIEMLMSSDTPIGISKSIGVAQISFAEAYEDLQPDAVLILGDRYEILSAVIAAMIARIPVIHLHGGEATEGVIDESIRHAITKMSHLHFVATEAYRKRVIQLGEQPTTVFNVGGMGIENIKKLKLLSQQALEKSIDFALGKKNILVTFHPVTLEKATAKEQFDNLLKVINQLPETKIIFTKPNSDTDGRVIIQMIDDYVAKNKDKAIAFNSLGQLRYLSALKFVDAVVGNSSSGWSEAPSFKIATIDIGDRQKGRIKATSVISCAPDQTSIANAFKKVYSQSFQNELKSVINPYGEGLASAKIVDVIKHTDFTHLLKKPFYNLEFII